MSNASERIDKPWGYEIILERNDRFVVKEILLYAGERSSLQMHERKQEWVRIERGTIDLITGLTPDELETHRLGEGSTYRVPAGTVHRVIAVEEAVILEVATPGDDDIIRLQDDYGR